ncbi:hypothetical protein IWZ03DRAFT_428023 [Phyllosticta citriasiana]|uniref:Uncharacterized protein n=1 Tax=Phyllosticta citriasiana TaxID=595635 RepID=A0ABR1KXC2_9PEZI
MATADVSTHPELKIARSAQQTCGPLRTSRDACNGEFFRIVTSVTQQRTFSKSSTCTARSDVGNRLSINVGPAFHAPPATAPATAMIEELPTPPCRIRPAACMSRRSSGNPGLDWDDECRKRRVKPQRKRCNRVAQVAPVRPAIRTGQAETHFSVVVSDVSSQKPTVEEQQSGKQSCHAMIRTRQERLSVVDWSVGFGKMMRVDGGAASTRGSACASGGYADRVVVISGQKDCQSIDSKSKSEDT